MLHAIEYVRGISVTDRASCEVGFSLASLGFFCPSPPVSLGTIPGIMMNLHRPLCLDTWSPGGGDVLGGYGTFRRWDFSKKKRIMGVECVAVVSSEVETDHSLGKLPKTETTPHNIRKFLKLTRLSKPLPPKCKQPKLLKFTLRQVKLPRRLWRQVSCLEEVWTNWVT